MSSLPNGSDVACLTCLHGRERHWPNEDGGHCKLVVCMCEQFADRWPVTLEDRMHAAYEAVSNASNPTEGECECGLTMDAHAGGMALLHHDTHLIGVIADAMGVDDEDTA